MPESSIDFSRDQVLVWWREPLHPRVRAAGIQRPGLAAYTRAEYDAISTAMEEADVPAS